MFEPYVTMDMTNGSYKNNSNFDHCKGINFDLKLSRARFSYKDIYICFINANYKVQVAIGKIHAIQQI